MVSTSSLQSQLASCENVQRKVCWYEAIIGVWQERNQPSRLYTVEPLYSGHHTNLHFIVCSKVSLTQDSNIFPVGVVCVIWLLSTTWLCFQLSLAVRWGEKAKQRLVLWVGGLINVQLVNSRSNGGQSCWQGQQVSTKTGSLRLCTTGATKTVCYTE